MRAELPDDFYDRIKPKLHERIGRELRLAYRVVDLGCGSCDLARYLAEAYGQRVTGVDISGKNFPDYEELDRTYDNIECIRHDAGDIDFLTNAADAVVMLWSLHEMEHVWEVLRKAYQALRAGGEMLIVDFPRGSLASRLWQEDYYTAKQVEQLMREAGLSEVRVKLIEQGQVIWAKGHRGPRRSSAGAGCGG